MQRGAWRMVAGLAAALWLFTGQPLLQALDLWLHPPSGLPAVGIILRDIPYVAGSSDPRQQLDLYLPAGVQRGDSTAHCPVVLWVHSGGWISGGREDAAQTLAPFVEQGWIGVGVGYRLATEQVFPAQLDDLRAALRWLRTNINEYGGDRERIVAYGASAGGQLVMLLGLSANSPPEKIPGTVADNLRGALAGVMSFAGPSDLTGWQCGGPMLAVPVDKLLGADCGAAAPLPGSAAASPLLYADRGDPPLLCIHGAWDDVVPIAQSQQVVSRLQQAGVRAVLLEVPQHGHSGWFHNDPAMAEPWREIYSFARECVKQSEGAESGEE